MWLKQEFIQILSDKNDNKIQEILQALDGYNRDFFFMDKERQEDILMNIIDACTKYIDDTVDLTTRKKLSVNELQAKYPNVAEILELQKQAVRLLYSPEVELVDDPSKNIEQINHDFLTKTRWALITAQIEPDRKKPGRNVDTAFWTERHFQGYNDLGPWLSGTKSDFRTYLEIIYSDPNVIYLDNPEEYKVFFQDGKVMIEKEGKLEIINKVYPAWHQKFIFVMDYDGNCYMHPEIANDLGDYNRFHHSTFLEGKRVLSAGVMDIDDGVVIEVQNNSGHYKPRGKNLLPALTLLQMNNINLNKVLYTDIVSQLSYNASDFLKMKGLCFPKHKGKLADLFCQRGFALSHMFGHSKQALQYFELAVQIGSSKALAIYGCHVYDCENIGAGLIDMQQLGNLDNQISELHSKGIEVLTQLIFIKHTSPEAASDALEAGQHIYKMWKKEPNKMQHLNLSADLGFPKAIFERALKRLTGQGLEVNIELGLEELDSVLYTKMSETSMLMRDWDVYKELYQFIETAPNNIKSNLLETFNEILIHQLIEAIQDNNPAGVNQILKTGINPNQTFMDINPLEMEKIRNNPLIMSALNVQQQVAPEVKAPKDSVQRKSVLYMKQQYSIKNDEVVDKSMEENPHQDPSAPRTR